MDLKDILNRYGKIDFNDGFWNGNDKYEFIGLVPKVKPAMGRDYVVRCKDCAEDFELYGEGLFIATYHTKNKKIVNLWV